MLNPKIDSSLFTQNRGKLSSSLKQNSIAVINSNDILPTNADGTMKFKQNSDLFYFTGIMQEETILLLFPDAKDEKFREILFIRDYNKDLEVWEGKKLTVDDAKAISGISNVMDLSKFEGLFHDLLSIAGNVYLNSNEHDRASVKIQTKEFRFITYCRQMFPLHNYMRLAPLIYRLRQIKSPVEIELISKACRLTGKAFERILKFVKPGVYEYQIEAEMAHEFISSGCGFADYEPIIASGENSCFLHYVKNDAPCNDGDILLLDYAAGYANYNADMTRTIPVNGKYSDRQKEIYNLVLRAMRGTVKEMKPGKTARELQLVTRELLAKELIDLKLLKPADVKDIKNKSENFRKLYPHDVSHFLGLGVHDVGYFDDPLEAGMVLTCEPGIYIREEKIGVRIENDILITETGNLDLMADIPIEADEIESIMNSK